MKECKNPKKTPLIVFVYFWLFTLLKITTIQQAVNGYGFKQVFNSNSQLLWARKFKAASYTIKLLLAILERENGEGKKPLYPDITLGNRK